MAIKDSDKVLVDTSVWIDYFCKKEPAYGIVSDLLQKEQICSIGIIMAELLQGAKSMKEVTVIKDFIHIFEFLPEMPQLWEQTGEISFHLRRKGKIVALSDCFIAVMSKRYNTMLLTFDTDLTAIKEEMELNLYPIDGARQ